MFTLLTSTPTVLGYIDPGAGSMLLQLALAGALTGLHLLGLRVSKVREYVRSLRKGHA